MFQTKAKTLYNTGKSIKRLSKGNDILYKWQK